MKWLKGLWSLLRRQPTTQPPDDPVMTSIPGYRDLPVKPVEADISLATEEEKPSSSNVRLSDLDLLPDHQRQLFEQLAPSAPEKVIAYPPPAEQTTSEWVNERLKELGYDPEAKERFMAFARSQGLVGPRAGYSMRYLGELKRRADNHDRSLMVYQLVALRVRGIV